MSRGILSGVMGGAVVGGVVVAVLSLYAPLPGEDGGVEQPSEDAQAVEPTEPTVPAAPEPSQETVTAQPETVEQEPAAEDQAAAPADQPGPNALIEAPEAGTAVEGKTVAGTTTPGSDPALGATDTPALARDEAEVAVTTPEPPSAPDALATDATAPEQPAEIASLPQVSDLADAPAGDASSGSGLSLPQVDATPNADAQTAPRVIASAQPDAAEATPGQTAEATTVSADTPIILPVPKIDNPVAGVVTNRLPSVTAPADEAESAEAEVQEAALDANEVGALKAYAAPYEGAPAAALMSIILIDSGADGMPREELVALGVPFSVAIDPVAEGAGEAAALYRSAGIEVLALVGDLPASAAPGDVAVALEGYFGVLNEAIAVMDPLDGRIQSNRSLLQPVLGTIRDTGHGLVTYDRGLNTAQQAARREGIAAATVFRLLDADLEEGPKIKRYLNRAAFTASKDGSVVVLGRSYPETVKALLEWSLDEKGGDLAIVPVSQVMLQDLG